MGPDDAAAAAILNEAATDPYRRLVRLAELERDLLADGRVDELRDVDDVRRRIVETLPGSPPAEAVSLLQRCAELQSETSAALEEALRTTELQLHRLGSGRAAVRGYTPGEGVRPVLDWAG